MPDEQSQNQWVEYLIWVIWGSCKRDPIPVKMAKATWWTLTRSSSAGFSRFLVCTLWVSRSSHTSTLFSLLPCFFILILLVGETAEKSLAVLETRGEWRCAIQDESCRCNVVLVANLIATIEVKPHDHGDRSWAEDRGFSAGAVWWGDHSAGGGAMQLALHDQWWLAHHDVLWLSGDANGRPTLTPRRNLDWMFL